MFDPSCIIVGLELGTSKVCAVVGEIGAEGDLEPLAEAAVVERERDARQPAIDHAPDTVNGQ